jgi:hypothetical protein
MSLRQLWTIAGQGRADVQRSAVLTLVRQLDELARGLGYTRPSSTPAPQTIPTTDDGGMIERWGAWYDSIAPQATTMPLSVLESTTNAPAGTWSSDLALARERNAPTPVTAYLSVQNASWLEARQAFEGHPMGSAVVDALDNARRSAEQWWFTRMGGTTGPMSPFAGPTGQSGARTSTASQRLRDFLKVAIPVGFGILVIKKAKG